MYQSDNDINNLTVFLIITIIFLFRSTTDKTFIKSWARIPLNIMWFISKMGNLYKYKK